MFGSDFHILMSPVPLKIGSMSPKANYSLPLSNQCFNASLIRICLSVIQRECRQGSFWQLRPMVTLKLWTRSPKYKQDFRLSQSYNTPSLDSIHPLIQEMWHMILKKSPISNHFLPLSQLCSRVNVVRIHRFVLKIECRQSSFRQSK